MFHGNQHPLMIYGAYGFTGRLIVEEALRRGHRPILAGRDVLRLRAMAKSHDLNIAVLSLDDTKALDTAVRATSLVFNAAGPFSETAPKLIESCLRTAIPYVDISGEFHHLRAVEAFDQQAREAGIPLLTGAGFGVTFGDCLARHVVDRLPDATDLLISVAADNAQTTPAVRRTILDVIAKGGYAVEGGKWVRRPLAHRLWTVRDGAAQLPFAAAPMGELAAARLSTGVSNIVVGRPMPHKTAKRLRMLSPLVQGILSISPLRNVLGRDRGKPAVSAPEPKQGWRSYLVAEARNARGDRAVARLETGEGYAFTAHAALANVEALLARKLAGAFTPASAFGAGHVLTIPGVSLIDLDPETGSPLERVAA